MGDALARRRLLTSARAELLDRPDVALPGIPHHVAASWRRSVARGVDPGVITNRFHPDLDVESRLVRCARPVIERLADQGAGIPVCGGLRPCVGGRPARAPGPPVCSPLPDERARLLVRLDTTMAMGRIADGNNF